MRSDREIRKLIADKKRELSDQEVFSSSGYKHVLSGIATAVTGRYQRPVRLRLLWDELQDITASTNGDDVMVNTGWSVLTKNNRPQRHLEITGLLSHELSHCISTDFKEVAVATEAMTRGWYPYPPNMADAKEQATVREISNAFEEKPALRKLYATVVHELHNHLEDYYVDELMCIRFPGTCRYGIEAIKRLIFLEQTTIAEQLDNGLKKFEIFYNLLLEFIYFETVQTNPTEMNLRAAQLEKEILEKLVTLQTVILQARQAVKCRDRYIAANQIFVKLWDWLEQYVLEEQPQEKASEASNEKIAEKTEALEKSRTAAGAYLPTPSGKGKGEPVSAKEQALLQSKATEVGASKSVASSLFPEINGPDALALHEGIGTLAAENYEAAAPYPVHLGKLEEELAAAAADEILERELTEEQKKFLDGIIFPRIHKWKPIVVKRMSFVPPSLQEAYECVRPEVEQINRRLCQSVLDVFREKQSGAKLTSLSMGRRLMGNALYREDGRLFYNRTLPQERPELSVALLVDQSLSMNGLRIQFAQKAALVLHLFCLSMGIPVMVMGHTERSGNNSDVELYNYADFDKPEFNNQLRIMDMRAIANNRDGAAVRFVGEKLARRSERYKLMFVLSDGQPRGAGYSGAPAMEDLRELRRELNRKNVILIAAAIGSDKQKIHDCYGDAFLDITDLSALPVTLALMLRKYIG